MDSAIHESVQGIIHYWPYLSNLNSQYHATEIHSEIKLHRSVQYRLIRVDLNLV